VGVGMLRRHCVGMGTKAIIWGLKNVNLTLKLLFTLVVMGRV
jgi:hypothetical protein